MDYRPLIPTSQIVLVAILLLSATGCGRSGNETYPITGTVTLDGQPLSNGSLIFIPSAPGVSAEGGQLSNGTFSMRARAGTNRVEIRAGRERPGKKDPTLPAQQNQEQYLPARYNSDSKLTAEVTPAGPNRFEFKLSLKP